MNQTRAEMLAVVAWRRDHLNENRKTTTGHEEELRRQLAALEQALIDDRFSRQAWEQHDLLWEAYRSELRRSIVRQSAHIMMAVEALDRKDPHHFDDQPDARRQLYWWQHEGGREQFLSEITLEERRALEAMEQDWKKKEL